MLSEAVATGEIEVTDVPLNASIDCDMPNGGWVYFKFCVPEERKRSIITVHLTPLQGNPDVFVSNITLPSLVDYVWRPSAAGRPRVVIYPSDPAAAPGDYFVGVFARSAAGFTMYVHSYMGEDGEDAWRSDVLDALTHKFKTLIGGSKKDEEEAPQGGVDAFLAEDPLGAPALTAEDELQQACIKIQCMYRGYIARREMDDAREMASRRDFLRRMSNASRASAGRAPTPADAEAAQRESEAAADEAARAGTLEEAVHGRPAPAAGEVEEGQVVDEEEDKERKSVDADAEVPETTSEPGAEEVDEEEAAPEGGSSEEKEDAAPMAMESPEPGQLVASGFVSGDEGEPSREWATREEDDGADAASFGDKSSFVSEYTDSVATGSTALDRPTTVMVSAVRAELLEYRLRLLRTSNRAPVPARYDRAKLPVESGFKKFEGRLGGEDYVLRDLVKTDKKRALPTR